MCRITKQRRTSFTAAVPMSYILVLPQLINSMVLLCARLRALHSHGLRPNLWVTWRSTQIKPWQAKKRDLLQVLSHPRWHKPAKEEESSKSSFFHLLPSPISPTFFPQILQSEPELPLQFMIHRPVRPVLCLLTARRIWPRASTPQSWKRLLLNRTLPQSSPRNKSCYNQAEKDFASLVRKPSVTLNQSTCNRHISSSNVLILQCVQLH